MTAFFMALLSKNKGLLSKAYTNLDQNIWTK